MSRLVLAAIVFYASTVALAIGGFSLAATGRYSPGAILGGCAVLSAIISAVCVFANTGRRDSKP